jgi:sugar O-acyltransferase (sialic acid O-acetyltransferase NeuD family)
MKMTRVKFGLIGAGGLGREVMPFTKSAVSKTLGILENDIDVYFLETWDVRVQEVNGYPLISLTEFTQLDGEKYFNVAVGSGNDREQLVAAMGSYSKPLSLIAPQVIIFERNIIASGAVFCPNTMVTSNTTIGKFFQCNIYAYVAHDCVIGDYVTFAPGVRCNGRVHIGDYAYVGTNAVIREGTVDKPLRIGKGAVIGMGAVVTKDVPDGTTVVGNPARAMNKA